MNVRNTDLRLLHCFEALYAKRSVSLAAQQMHLTQPAMSNALARLRETFGDPLFVRTKEGLLPTPRALSLAEPVRTVLDGVDTIFSSGGTFDPAAAQTHFVMTAPEHVGGLLLPPLMRRLKEAAPGVTIEVRHADRERAASWIQSGEIDFRIGWLRSPPQNLHLRALYHDRLVCLVRKDHPQVRDKLTLPLFCSVPHARAMLNQGSDTPRAVDVALAALGRKLHVALQVQDFMVLPFVVAHSDLIGVMPERVAAAFTRGLPLRIVQAPLKLPQQTIAMYWHERTHRSPAHVWFRGLLAGLTAKTVSRAGARAAAIDDNREVQG